jgi:hypothetical protein
MTKWLEEGISSIAFTLMMLWFLFTVVFMHDEAGYFGNKGYFGVYAAIYFVGLAIRLGWFFTIEELR